MKLYLCVCPHNGKSIRGLLRRLGDALPENCPEPLKLAFAAEEDKSGQRVVKAIVDGEIRELLVATLPKDAKTRAWQKAIKKFYEALVEAKCEEPEIHLTGYYKHEEYVQVLKTFLNYDYRFEQFKTSGLKADPAFKKEEGYKAGTWKFVAKFDDKERIEAEAVALAESQAAARDLVNLPANRLTPVMLAAKAQELAERYDFECEVHGPGWIQEQGLEAYWNVAKGSIEEPRFIIMRYLNNPEAKDKILALVGKGLCYDSGGYAIKTAAGMVGMHTDMGGSAAVIGAITALARNKVKVNVVAIVAACENMISDRAFRNGDIIGSLSGKFIEVGNTDAEGRLTLADGVCYAWKQEKAEAIIDIATLTGACGVAVGDRCTAYMTDSERFAELAEAAKEFSGDKIWRLPFDEEYEECNKSERADIKNIGSHGAGTVTAGCFVKAFAGERPFLHLDIAPTAYYDSGNDRVQAGATGVGCELLYKIAEGYFA